MSETIKPGPRPQESQMRRGRQMRALVARRRANDGSLSMGEMATASLPELLLHALGVEHASPAVSVLQAVSIEMATLGKALADGETCDALGLRDHLWLLTKRVEVAVQLVQLELQHAASR